MTENRVTKGASSSAWFVDAMEKALIIHNFNDAAHKVHIGEEPFSGLIILNFLASYMSKRANPFNWLRHAPFQKHSRFENLGPYQIIYGGAFYWK